MTDLELITRMRDALARAEAEMPTGALYGDVRRDIVAVVDEANARIAAEAAQVGELPELPEPTCLGFRNPCGIAQLPDMGIYGYTADQIRAYARAAIAALRQPVPDAVRESLPKSIVDEAKRLLHWVAQGNADCSRWAGDADQLMGRIVALASQQESRNAD